MDLSKYKKDKVNGIFFYTNKNKGNNVMKSVIEQCPKEKFIVAQTFEFIRTEGRKTKQKSACKYGSVTEAEFNELIKTDNQIYDLMQTNEKYKHLRIVFDIDKKGKDVADPLNNSIAVIMDKFPGAILNISGSIATTDDGCTEYSYHIVLFNYVVEDVNEYELVQKLCIKHKDLGFDPSIYRVNGQYKCVNQSKKDGRFQKIFSGSDNPLDHSLRCNIPADPKTMADSNLKAEDFEVEKKKRGRPNKNKLDEDGEPEKKNLNF